MLLLVFKITDSEVSFIGVRHKVILYLKLERSRQNINLTFHSATLSRLYILLEQQTLRPHSSLFEVSSLSHKVPNLHLTPSPDKNTYMILVQELVIHFVLVQASTK